MRNDTERWPAAADGPRPGVDRSGVTLRRLDVPQQVVISGPRAAALSFADQPSAVGWPDLATGQTYALSLRRDRLLLVGAAIATFGWLDGPGLAVSDMSAGYDMFELRGPRAMAVLRTGTELSLNTPSESCLRLWHGYDFMLYRYGADDSFRMHMGRADAAAVWDMLIRQMDLVAA